jgi:hypothetical protein
MSPRGPGAAQAAVRPSDLRAFLSRPSRESGDWNGCSLPRDSRHHEALLACSREQAGLLLHQGGRSRGPARRERRRQEHDHEDPLRPVSRRLGLHFDRRRGAPNSLAEGRDGPRDLDDPAAFLPRLHPLSRREHHPRQREGRHRPPRQFSADRRACPRVRLRSRPRGPRARPPRRRPTEGRDPQGSLPEGQAPRHGRAHRRAHAAGIREPHGLRPALRGAGQLGHFHHAQAEGSHGGR